MTVVVEGRMQIQYFKKGAAGLGELIGGVSVQNTLLSLEDACTVETVIILKENGVKLPNFTIIHNKSLLVSGISSYMP